MGQIQGITLLPDEKIKLVIRRSWIGLALIWAAVVALVIVLTITWGVIINSQSGSPGLNDSFSAIAPAIKLPDYWLLVWIINGLLLVGGLVATFVYSRNELYVTSQRLIHRHTLAPFAESINAISLEDIEDVSMKREGPWAYIFRLGTIRMSTISDETTYIFGFVGTPQDEVDTIMSMVRRAKHRGQVMDMPMNQRHR